MSRNNISVFSFCEWKVMGKKKGGGLYRCCLSYRKSHNAERKFELHLEVDVHCFRDFIHIVLKLQSSIRISSLFALKPNIFNIYLALSPSVLWLALCPNLKMEKQMHKFYQSSDLNHTLVESWQLHPSLLWHWTQWVNPPSLPSIRNYIDEK